MKWRRVISPSRLSPPPSTPHRLLVYLRPHRLLIDFHENESVALSFFRSIILYSALNGGRFFLSKEEKKRSKRADSKETLKSTKSAPKESKKTKKNRGTMSKTKEEKETEKKSESKSGMNAPGTKSDPNSNPPEEVVGSLFKPKPKGEEGKAKLEKLLELFPDTPEEERPSTLVLQKVAAIETGAILPLKSENFFHFFLMEHEVWEKVRNPGEFLVRQLPLDEKDNDDDEEEYVICVMGKNKPLNIPIIFSSARNFCYINGYSFDTPAGLVQYHYRNHIPLDENGTRLLTPIMKDSIFINHAQIGFTNKFIVGSKGIAVANIRTGFFSSVQVAVMDYSTFAFEQGRLEDLYQVTRLARSCDHPNIIKYYGIAMSQAPAYILTEYCSQGTLGYIVRKPVGPDVGKREMYAHGLAKGLKYLEHRMILHRNIHIDNIYVDGKNQVKISEFANAIFGVKLVEKLGMITIRHIAPEAWKHNRFSKKSDIWSFGVVVWEIFHNGATPYDEIPDGEVARKVADADLRLKCISDKFPNKLWRICEKCWAKLADDRLSINEILEEMERDQRSSSGIFDRIYESFALLME